MKADTRVTFLIPGALVVTFLVTGIPGIAIWLWFYAAVRLIQFLSLKIRRRTFSLPVAHLISLVGSTLLNAATTTDQGTYANEAIRSFALYLVPQVVWLLTDWYIVKNLASLSHKVAQYGPSVPSLLKQTAMSKSPSEASAPTA